MLKLTYSPGTISVVTAITLHEAGLPFEPVRVDFANAEQTKPAYHQINPKGRVPALITDQGVVTETGAIQDYIATIAPSAGLVPQDAFQAATMRAVMYYLASTVHVNHAHKMRGSRWSDDETTWGAMKAKVTENMTGCAAYIESSLLAGPYTMGDAFSLADPYMFVVCNWLPGDGVDMDAFPGIIAFMDRMRARASVQAVMDQGMI